MALAFSSRGIVPPRHADTFVHALEHGRAAPLRLGEGLDVGASFGHQAHLLEGPQARDGQEHDLEDHPAGMLEEPPRRGLGDPVHRLGKTMPRTKWSAATITWRWPALSSRDRRRGRRASRRRGNGSRCGRGQMDEERGPQHLGGRDDVAGDDPSRAADRSATGNALRPRPGGPRSRRAVDHPHLAFPGEGRDDEGDEDAEQPLATMSLAKNRSVQVTSSIQWALNLSSARRHDRLGGEVRATLGLHGVSFRVFGTHVRG